jgi:ParB family chromosome partitioning protein
MAKELSVRATERLVSQLLKPGAGKAKTETTPALQRLGDALTRDLGTKVKIEGRPRGDRGRIVIEFYSRDELDRIVERMATA